LHEDGDVPHAQPDGFGTGRPIALPAQKPPELGKRQVTVLAVGTAACTYRIAFGPRAGQKVLTVQGVMPRDTVRDQDLCADQQGFRLHAAVRCDADERQRLEQLCRTITRPALANERVQINSAGQVVLKLKTAWRDGTTHIVMSPLEFMQRLAARATEGRLSGTRAAAQAAPDPLPWGAGAQCQAAGHGGAGWAGSGGQGGRGLRAGARLRTLQASAY